MTAMWWRHNGAPHGPGGLLTAVGQLTGLYAAFAVLMQLVLMARVPVLDRLIGMDRLARIHRWNGFAAVWLVVAHALAITLGYAAADRVSAWSELMTFVRHYPDVLMAIVAAGILVAIAVTSVRKARRRLAYETWYFVHLYAYLAVALGFAHQLAVGSDFTADPIARAYWWFLLILALGCIVVFRLMRALALNRRHIFRVAGVRVEAPGVISIIVSGKHLDELGAQAGQFFWWRILNRSEWWRAHPFSLSQAPNGRTMRITVKALGDSSARWQQLRPGTRLWAEGPHGAFTPEVCTRPRILLIGGGVGITPLRALFEALPGRPGDVTLIYRARTERDLLFRSEIDTIANARGFDVHYWIGRSEEAGENVFAPRRLRAAVPDVSDRDVFVCGPVGMTEDARRGLKAAGVPPAQIHAERFAF
jgi:predicted ferric reductase